MEHYETWIAKAEVLKRTGLTERTLERKVKRGEIRREYRNIPGRKPLPIFPPDQVDQLANKTITAKPIRQRGIVPRHPDLSELAAMMQVIERKLYLTLKEAALLSGLPLSYIAHQIRIGGIEAVKVGGWRIPAVALKQHRVPLTNQPLIGK